MSFFATDEAVGRLGGTLVERSLAALGPRGLAADKLAVTLLVHDRPLRATPSPGKPRGFAHRGDQPFYPCSVVKLFYLVAAQARLESRFIAPHEELDRAMRDMILVSSNMATNYVIDLVTGTTGDTLLPAADFSDWAEKRGWVNRYFRSFGWPELAPINLCQKLMDDQRYGRERQLVGADGANHNRLTTDATARLFHAVLTGQAVSPTRDRFVVETLARPLDPAWIAAEPAGQVLGYFGEGLPPGSLLWSKAGWTGWTGDPTASYRRHDAAYVELASGRAFTLVAFTEGQAISADLASLPTIARIAVELIG